MTRTGRPAKTFGCSVPGCDRDHYGRTLCRAHFYRQRRTGSAGDADIQKRTSTGDPCLVDGCDGVGHTRGLCNGHYLRLRSHGSVGSPTVRAKRSPNEGGRWIDNHGYVVVTLPEEGGRRIAEHRLVMERHLGRLLWPDESVHHKSGDKADNRIENLELWSRYQPAGQRVEDKLVWAKEIIERYAK